jgi:cysteinyl-tRNA synthetase
MLAYLQTVKKAGKENGFDTMSRRVDELTKKIESMQSKMLKADGKLSIGEMINSDEFNDVVKEVDKSMRNLDHQIERTEAEMIDMELDPDAITDLKTKAQEAADANLNLSNALENTDNVASETPKHFASTSEALTSLGGAAMATMSAITSLKNGFQTIFDPDTTGLEKASAAVTMFIAVLGAWNAVTAFSTTLKNIDTTAESKNVLAKMANSLATKVAALTKKSSTAA